MENIVDLIKRAAKTGSSEFSMEFVKSLAKIEQSIEENYISEDLLNKIQKKWDVLGFLSLNDIKNRNNLAIAYEIETKNCILTDFNKRFGKEIDSVSKYFFEDRVERVVFPIIARLFYKLTDESDMEICEINKIVNKIHEKVINTDEEGEFVLSFCENFEL